MTKLMYFFDGIRQVDYVIAFQFSSPSVEEPFQDFLINLLQHGIDIEIEEANGEPPVEFSANSNVCTFGRNKLIFAKLHVKWETLLQIAEILHFQKAIETGSGIMHESFSVSRKSAFKGFSDKENHFFTPLERILAAEYILNQFFHPNLEDCKSSLPKEAPLLPKSCSIGELFKKKVILATFPLHEPKENSIRSELMMNWASGRKILTLQGFNSIRDYFGEKVAFGFAWIQFYIWSLLCIFILAFVASLIPVFLRSRPLSISEDICLRNSTQFLMCPPCKAKGCRFRRLNTSCGDIVWSYFFDNPASVFLAFIAPIFGMLCLRLWMCQQSTLECRWHMQNFKAAKEPARRQFLERLNQEDHSLSNNAGLPLWSFRVPVLTFTWFITAVLISLSIGLELITDIIPPRLEVYFMQSESKFCNEFALFLAFGVKTLFNAVCVCILSTIYRAWIRWSTKLEYHPTQDQQEQTILMKSCLMEFINVFLSLFTAILFRALNYGYPGQNSTIFEPLEWPVWTGLFGIFYEIYIKCTVIVFVKTATDWLPLGQVKEILKNNVRSLVLGRQASTQRVELSLSPTYNHCLNNFNLDPSGGHFLFQRQFDMCIFIGFAVMFLPASFTWILTLLLLSIVTIRGFAIKITRHMQRLSPKPARSIGMWMWLLLGINSFAILTNACLIAFASEFVNKLVYQFYYSPNGSMMGYTNFSLSYMDVNQFEISEEDKGLLNGLKYCRYFGYREPPDSTNPYSLTSVFWHILAAKFIFVFIFMLSVTLINWLLSWLIPCAPRRLGNTNSICRKNI